MKKYYAKIKLFNVKNDYKIIGEIDMKKKEILEQVENFAKGIHSYLDKDGIYYDNKEIGKYKILSIDIM